MESQTTRGVTHVTPRVLVSRHERVHSANFEGIQNIPGRFSASVFWFYGRWLGVRSVQAQYSES